MTLKSRLRYPKSTPMFPLAMAKELRKIASVGTYAVLFRALDKLAMSSVAAGSANTHCRECGVKLKRPTEKCPKCGNDTSGLEDRAEEGGTGAEAAENESGYGESVESGGASSGKIASATRTARAAVGKLPPEFAAVLALAGGSGAGLKLYQGMKASERVSGQEFLGVRRGLSQKTASSWRRAGLSIRKPRVSSPPFRAASTPARSFKRLRRRYGASLRAVARSDI